MKFAIIGARGMLGTDFCTFLKYNNIVPIEWDLPEMDITNINQTIKQIVNAKPDIIFHFAAFTDVDEAEKNKSLAYSVNTLGTWAIAIAAKELKAKLLYMSTDYVFDGTKESAYLESDTPNPINYYGQTKFLGEKTIKEHLKKYFIVRTSWLFGKHGKNFVTTILNLAKEQECIEVVSDQIGCPTYTRDLCEPLLKIANSEHYGIYHLTNSGETSWYKFAQTIIKEENLINQIIPITSDKISRLAKRPANSVLENRNYQYFFKDSLRPWELALKDFLLELKIKK
ncbi:MAG: dTDP-4-dehydrorhamnose reductase [candidate division WOR-3 bacterium]